MSDSKHSKEEYWLSTDGNTLNDITTQFDNTRKKNKLRPLSSDLLKKLIQKYHDHPDKQFAKQFIIGLAIRLSCELAQVQNKFEALEQSESKQDNLDQQLQSEYSGMAPHLESMLQQILQIQGIHFHDEIKYGPTIPMPTRLQWQQMGMDPDSEDEVTNYLKQQPTWPLQNPGPFSKADRSQALATIEALEPPSVKAAPRPKPIK